MNYFTKEELWFINEHLKNSIDYNHVINPRLCIPILNKIQSMIDSYCEHEIMTADMKEYQSICVFNENGKTYFTTTSDIFACGSHASLDMAMKIICSLAIGNNKFSSEWIDRIIFRLNELKNKV